jgi:flagellum-specific peptidoglycan hydrolase FlgJ
MVVITNSVGEGGVNRGADVKKVQNLLNKNLHRLPGTKKLIEDGKAGRLTKAAILQYQKSVLKFHMPDGRVDPTGRTLKSLAKIARNSRPANVVAFIAKTLSDAKYVKLKFGIPISILIAQAALESGWGRYVKGNAYFGIKSHKTKGATTSFATTEFVNGKKVSVTDSFRAYANFGESAKDYGKFLKSNPRYSSAFIHSKDPYKFADQLQLSGYATDPQYANKLKAIIKTYYLDEYDQ